MSKFVFIYLCVFLFYFPSLYAGFGPVMTSSFGLLNISLTENDSQIITTDPDVVPEEEKLASVSTSLISVDFSYEFSQTSRRSLFLKASFPGMSSNGDGLFAGGIGLNYYFNPLSSVFQINDQSSMIILIPKFRFYIGGSTGVGYLIYNTISAKKTDVLFDLSLHLGASYNLSQKWAMRAEASATRGTGVTTTSLLTRFMLGASYFF